MTLEYKLSFVLNGKEQKAFQDYLNKVDCSLNAVVPIMIREFLMNDNQVVEEKLIYDREFDERLNSVEANVNLLLQAQQCLIDKAEKFEEVKGYLKGVCTYITVQLSLRSSYL